MEAVLHNNRRGQYFTEEHPLETIEQLQADFGRIMNTPSASPRYAGKTPAEVVRQILRPIGETELRNPKARCRKKSA